MVAIGLTPRTMLSQNPRMLKVDINQYTALVCGASDGIGKAIAKELASQGARVILLARRQEELDKLLGELPAHPKKHRAVSVDLSQTEELKSKIFDLVKTESIEIVINNAGGPPSGPLLDAEVDVFEKAFRTHIVAAHTLAKLVVPGMKQKKYGRFINIISTSVKTPLANLGVSNTIRGAMASWAKSLANEVGGFGITVNNVLPGYTKTARLDQLMKATGERMKIAPEQVEKNWLSTIPAGRFGQSEELAEAVAFLASPAASYISGINLPVDGGRTPSL